MNSTDNKTPAHPLVHSALQLVKSATAAFSKAQLAFASNMKDDQKRQAIALIAHRKVKVAQAFVQLNLAYDQTSKTVTCVCCEKKFAPVDIAATLQIGAFCVPCLAVYDYEVSHVVKA
jgi:hypothetical protein